MSKGSVTTVALRLPPRSRARQAARPMDGLGSASRRQLDKQWAAEVESRIDAYDAGRMKAVPAAKVMVYSGRKLFRK